MSERAKILVIDDEPALREVLVEMLQFDFDVAAAETADAALAQIDVVNPEVVLSDVNLPGLSGIEFLNVMGESHADIPVIILTAHSDKATAIEALRGRAFDFFEKPIDFSTLKVAIHRAIDLSRYNKKKAAIQENLSRAKRDIEQQAHELEQLYASATIDQGRFASELLPECFDRIVTQNSKMLSALQYAAAIAKTGLPVLITGETGTGKDLVAQAVHAASRRKGTFVAANVAGLDDALFSDTLFGHVSGAFTSADRKRCGLVESAAGGTLFLDEIGDLSATSQVKLLRLLECGEYYPLGSDQVKRTDARIVVATHRDIEAHVESGRFREDLFFRLKAHHVQLPVLRERLDDLAMLVEHFLADAAKDLQRTKPTVPRELTTLLSTYPFPGNLRELRGMVYDAVSRHKAGVLSLETFKEKMANLTPKTPANKSPSDEHPVFKIDPQRLPTLKEAEEYLVQEALRRADGNQSIAARLLGLSRQALNKRLVRKQKAS